MTSDWLSGSGQYRSDMPQTELDILRDLSQRLTSAGIDFMLTGSMALNYYAQPRMTRDIDLVIALSPDVAETLIRLFESDYYVSREAVARAISHRSIFNVIHHQSVIKVDFIILKDEPFRQEEFARRQEITLADFKTQIVTREDLILSKLFWARDTRSEVQLRDVRNLLASQCDFEYLRRQALTLGIDALLEELLARDE